MKSVELKKEQMLTYDTIWESEPEVSATELLTGIPVVPAIEQIAFLLQRLVNQKKDQKSFHAHELTMWMMQLGGDTQKRTLKFVTEEKPFNIPGFTLTNRRVCLSFLQELLSCPYTSGETLTNEQQGKLFKAMLLLNSDYLKTQEKLFNWDGEGSDEMFSDLILPSRISNLGISKRSDYQVQFMKSCYFFEFCTSDSEYQTYLKDFLKHKGFISYEQYMLNVLHPYLTLMTNKDSSPKFAIDKAYKESLNFFDQFAINGKIIVHEDFKTLREFPLFKGVDNTYTVLFGNFLIDKLYMGFLFDFVHVLNKAGFSKMDFGKLKTDMGNRFSEQKMFYRAMHSCFKNYGRVRMTGEELKVFLKDSEPDYFIRDGRKLFLFEFKDVLLRSSVKSSESAEAIREELSEKLDESTNKRSKAQSKAVQQLFKSIKIILSGTYREKGIDDFNHADVMIYPILVHTDVALEAEGVNYFLKRRLNTLIAEGGMPKHRIKDLVVINIDMLLSIQDLFANRKIALANCINEFIAYTNIGGPMNRMMAFDEFLKYYLFKKNESFLTTPNEFLNLVNSFTEISKNIGN